MTRYHGRVGFGIFEEKPAGSGKWVSVITEHAYYGAVTRDSRRLDTNEQANPNIISGHVISIVADAYANANYSTMKYIEWNGAFWIASNVEVQAPRLNIRLGGVYNGPKAATPEPVSGDD